MQRTSRSPGKIVIHSLNIIKDVIIFIQKHDINESQIQSYPAQSLQERIFIFELTQFMLGIVIEQ